MRHMIAVGHQKLQGMFSGRQVFETRLGLAATEMQVLAI